MREPSEDSLPDSGVAPDSVRANLTRWAYLLRVRRSWVIPCYQEADALDAGLDALLALPGDELVFVDDGSTDGTAPRLADAKRRDPRVRVVTHPKNRGVGAAMRSGFSAAT